MPENGKCHSLLNYFWIFLTFLQATLPNLRRLFIESRTDDEEREISRKAVSSATCLRWYRTMLTIDSVLQCCFIHGLCSCIQSHRPEAERWQMTRPQTLNDTPSGRILFGNGCTINSDECGNSIILTTCIIIYTFGTLQVFALLFHAFCFSISCRRFSLLFPPQARQKLICTGLFYAFIVSFLQKSWKSKAQASLITN